MFGKAKSIFLVKICEVINKLREKSMNFSFSEQRNILIINVQGVGDMVIFTPVIEALAKKYPQTKITMLTSDYGSEVLKNNPHIVEIIPIPNINHFLLFPFLRLVKLLRGKKFDCVIDTSLTCFSFKQILLPYFTGATIRISFRRHGFSHLLPSHEIFWKKEHMLNTYGHIVELFGTTIKPKPKIYLTEEDRQWAEKKFRKKKKPIVVIHPSCQGEEKKWPIENFAQLIFWLKREYKGTIFVTGITKEQKELEFLQRKAGNDFSLLFDVSLPKIAAALQQTDLLISLDTGIVHIATAMNTPTLCLYGPTGQIFWKPYNNNQLVFQKHPCAEVGNNPNTDQVIESVKKCPSHGHECIKAISVCDVQKMIKEKLLK